MRFLKEIEDRYLVVGLTLVAFVGYALTADATLGDILKIMIGVTGGIFARRSEKLLIAGSDERADIKAAIERFGN